MSSDRLWGRITDCKLLDINTSIFKKKQTTMLN